MKIFHLGLSSKHVEIGQGNTMQTMQTQNLQQVSNQSGFVIFYLCICYFRFVNLLFSICVFVFSICIFVIFNLLFLDCETAAHQLWLVPITLPLSLSSFPQQKRTWSIKEETRYIVQRRVHDDIKGKSQCTAIVKSSSQHAL